MPRPKITKVVVDVPLTSGLAQKEDPKWLPMGQANTATNLIKGKQSTIETSPGWNTTGTYPAPAPNSVISLGTLNQQLVTVGTTGNDKAALYMLQPAAYAHVYLDQVPEVRVEAPVPVASYDQPLTEMDTAVFYAPSLSIPSLVVFLLDPKNSGDLRVYWGLLDPTSKSWFTTPREVSSLTAINNGVGFTTPKLISNSNGKIILVVGAIGTTSIYATKIDAVVQTWGTATVLTSTVYTNFWLNHSPTGVFDVCIDENDSTTFLLAYQINNIGVNAIDISSFSVANLTLIQGGVLTDSFWTTTHGLGALFGTGANGGSPLSGIGLRASSLGTELKAWVTYAWHWYQSGTGASISQAGNLSTITGLTGLTAGQTGFIAIDGSVHANNNFGGQGPTTTTALGGQPFTATGAGTVTVNIVGSPIVTDAGPLDYRINVTTSPSPVPIPVIPNYPKSYIRAAAMNMPGLTTTTCTPVDLTNGLPTTYPGPQLLDIAWTGTIAGQANTQLVVWSAPSVKPGYNAQYVLSPALSHAPPLCAIYQSSFYSASGTGTLQAQQPRWTNNVTLASRIMPGTLHAANTTPTPESGGGVWVVGWLPSNNLSPTGSGVANVAVTSSITSANIPYDPYVTFSGGTLGVGQTQMGAQASAPISGEAPSTSVMYPSANVLGSNYSNASNNAVTTFATNFTANVTNVVMAVNGSGYTSAPAAQLNWGAGASLSVTYAPGFNTSPGAVNQAISSIQTALVNGISAAIHDVSGSTAVVSGLATKSISGAMNTVEELVSIYPEVIGQKLNIGNAAQANNNGDWIITGFVSGTGATVVSNNVQATGALNYSVIFTVQGLSGVNTAMVGETLTLTGSDVPGNNRRWLITNVFNATSVSCGSVPAGTAMYTAVKAPTGNSVTANNISWTISSAQITRSDGKSFTGDANNGHLTWQIDNNSGAGAGYNYNQGAVPLWIQNLDPSQPNTYTNLAVAKIITSGGNQGRINNIEIVDPNTLANITFPYGAYAFIPQPGNGVANISYATGIAGAAQLSTTTQLVDNTPYQNIQGTFYLFSIDTWNDVTTPNDTGAPYRNVPMRWIATLKPRLGINNLFSTAKTLPHWPTTTDYNEGVGFGGLLPINVSPLVVSPTWFQLLAVPSSGIAQGQLELFTDKQSSELGGLAAFSTGLPFQTDGTTAFEFGFPYYPENITAFAGALPNQGDLQAGATYEFIATYQRRDNAGNVHRSGRSVPVQIVTLPINDSTYAYSAQIAIPTMGFSLGQHGVSAFNSTASVQIPCTIQLFRTTANEGFFYNVLGTPAGVYQNDLWSPYVFAVTGSTPPQIPYVNDDQISQNPALYGDGSDGVTQGSILDNLTPPSFQGMITHKNRWFGIDGSNIWYTKAYTSGEGLAFNELMAFSVDDGSFPVTALASMDERLIIFKRDRIFYLVGDGPADNGSNNDFQPPQRIVSAVGAVDWRSVVVSPLGVWFNSDDGLYLLTRKLEVQPAGKFVEDVLAANGPIITASGIDPGQGLIYWATGARIQSPLLIVYSYTLDCWTTFQFPYNVPNQDLLGDISSMVLASPNLFGANSFNARVLYIGVNNSYLSMFQDTIPLITPATGNPFPYQSQWEGPWVHGPGIDGFDRFLQVLVNLGSIGGGADFSTYDLQVELGYNYNNQYQDSFTVTSAALTAATVGPHLQWAFQPTNPKAESIRIRITCLPHAWVFGNQNGSHMQLWGVTVVLGTKEGVMRLPVAQRGSK